MYGYQDDTQDEFLAWYQGNKIGVYFEQGGVMTESPILALLLLN